MQVLLQDWRRSRAEHSTACWDCYRGHRGCDGGRPCSRCTMLGREASCRDPEPKERTQQRKRKPQDGRPLSHTKRKCFFLLSPQTFAPKPPPKRKRRPSISAIQCNTSDSASSRDRQEEASPVNLDEYTESLQEPQTTFNEIMTDKRETSEHIKSIFDRLNQTSYLTPKRLQSQLSLSEIPPSGEDLMEEILLEIEESRDHDHHTSASVFKSLPNDMTQMCSSLFMPFVLEDATQPFLVVKPIYPSAIDLPALAPRFPAQTVLLTASPAFCKLTQYPEEDILGTNYVKLLPECIKVSEDQIPALMALLPQPRPGPVSPVFKVQHYYRIRNGCYIHLTAKTQFFYAPDTTVSFIVLGVDWFAFSEDDIPPTPPSTTTPHTSNNNDDSHTTRSLKRLELYRTDGDSYSPFSPSSPSCDVPQETTD